MRFSIVHWYFLLKTKLIYWKVKGGGFLKKTIHRDPIMLYESVEMVRAFVNAIRAEKLVGAGTYSIPPEVAEDMITTACSGLDRDDPELQFFFQTHALDDSKYGEACIARALVYSFFDLECSDFEKHIAMLTHRWAELRTHPFEITDINAFSPEFKPLPEEGWSSLGTAFNCLSLEHNFTLALVEAFSNYTYYLNRLGEILLPIARKLRVLLEPWIQAADPLADEWDSFFQEASVEDFLYHRGSVEDDFPFQNAVISLRYFDACTSPGRLSETRSTIWIHVGVALPVGMTRGSQQESIEEHQYEAFRLLGDRSRADMINLLSDQSLKMQDISSTLDINPGTVSRNLNSLNNAGLLIKETIGGRYFYRTNKEFLRSIVQNVLKYLEGGSGNSDK